VVLCPCHVSNARQLRWPRHRAAVRFSASYSGSSQVRPQQDVPAIGTFYDEPMMRVPESVRSWFRQRSQQIPMGLSWSFAFMIHFAWALIAVWSALQRTRADLPTAAMAALLAVSPFLLSFVSGIKFTPALVWTTSSAATVILLFTTSTPIATDFAPLLLVLMVGCIALLVPVLYAGLAFASAVALLAVASAAHRLEGLALYLSFVALGWLVGYLMRTQQQLLVKQQQMQAYLAEHAAADERRRIAREVHDVIAHSLSVTLLHVTGARHALQQDCDIDDAVDALTDAERLGRQAMTDIRRTVGLLEAGPTKMAPEPGIADIGDLIDDFVQAGLQVTLHTKGATDQVSAAIGLALYRITQESLANIAKHAPTSKAAVDLVISPTATLLSIVNEMPVVVGVGAQSADGRGLSGMRQRVQLLGGLIDAGPCDHGWSVRAEIPLTDASSRRCPL
jgi:signal transduction histidine kinase